MKLGMNLLLWTTHLDKSHIPLLRQVRSWGYDGVEAPLFSLDQIDAGWIREVVADAGLGITGVTALPPEANLVGETEREQHAGLEHIRRSIEFTQKMGATLLCGPLYSPVGRLFGRGRSTDEWNRAVANLREVARTASDHGVVVAIEPLNRFETYVLNTAADTCALLEEVGSDSLGVQLDTFHANIEEKSIGGAIRACGRRMAHLHVSENDRGIPGSGHVEWDDAFAALRDIGYQGWMVVESFSQALPEIAAATAMWRPLAPSSEVYAQESLKFLKRKLGAAAAN